MAFAPGFLEGIRNQLHRRVAEVQPRFNRWDKKHTDTSTPDENDHTDYAGEMATAARLPRTWEAAAQWFAAKVRVDGWKRRDVPKEFHDEVSRLIHGTDR